MPQAGLMAIFGRSFQDIMNAIVAPSFTKMLDP